MSACAGFFDRNFFQVGQEFDLTNLAVAGLSQVDSFVSFLARIVGPLHRQSRNFNLCLLGLSCCQLRSGQFFSSFGRISGLCRLLGTL